MSNGAERRAATAQWLTAQGIRDPQHISSEDHAELITLLAPHRGFGIFWSVLAYARAYNSALLQNLNLTTPESVARASQFQGMIKAIDEVRELILNIADPLAEGSESRELEQESLND